MKTSVSKCCQYARSIFCCQNDNQTIDHDSSVANMQCVHNYGILSERVADTTQTKTNGFHPEENYEWEKETQVKVDFGKLCSTPSLIQKQEKEEQLHLSKTRRLCRR